MIHRLSVSIASLSLIDLSNNLHNSLSEIFAFREDESDTENWRRPSVGLSGKGATISPDTTQTTFVLPNEISVTDFARLRESTISTSLPSLQERPSSLMFSEIAFRKNIGSNEGTNLLILYIYIYRLTRS
jgi:hypothetical protein